LEIGEGVPSWAYKEIFVRECYAPPQPLPEEPVIFDIGANIGLASLYFLHRFPNCRLVAFEPNPRAFSLLCKNLSSLAHFGSLDLHPVALSSRAGRVGLYIERGVAAPFNASTTGRDTQAGNFEIVEVEMADARIFLTEHVDLMKMDIEGSELELLLLPEIVPERVRAIVVEIHDIHARGAEVQHVVDTLLARGYEMSGAAGVNELCGRQGSHVVSFAARR
jgi:FkbM family methyltransferase